MKIYLINNENEAKQIGQLLKLNAECAKLHWSKTMPDIPANVISSLEIIESFVEEKVYSICNENTCVGSLTEDEGIRNDGTFKRKSGVESDSWYRCCYGWR